MRAGPTRPSVRNQRVVQKDVVTNESRRECAPSGVPLSAAGSPLGVRVLVATRDESGCVCGHGIRGVLDHSEEHLGRCSNEELALNQTLELNAKGCDAELC